MNQLRLSFILPCYNVEKYIGDCLDSLYDQDISESEFEVICINDCSPDNSRNIIAEYQKKHSNLVLIDHAVNKTAGGARNTGIDNARGKYVWFVDPDDMIKSNVVQQLLDICEKENLDELLFNFEMIDEMNDAVNGNVWLPETKICSGMEFVNHYFKGSLSELSIVWNRIYRKKFLNQYKISFPEIRIGEDVSFAWRSLLLAEKIRCLSQTSYIYRVNTNSVSSQIKKKKGDLLFIRSFFFAKEILNLAEEIKQTYNDISMEMLNTAQWAANHFFSHLKELPNNEKEVFYDLCIKNKALINNLSPHMTKLSQRALTFTRLGFPAWVFSLKLLGSWQIAKQTIKKHVNIRVDS
jgi:glycosyltransferase involved in cell wall biosynthesis